MPAPIALFAFDRPGHLAHTIASLRACAEAAASDLTIFCDGPRRDTDGSAVNATRDVARTTAHSEGFRSVRVVEGETNIGLSAAITGGVSEMLTTHECVIVVEDDLEVSPWFLRYLNQALELWAEAEQVAAIHAYAYPVSVRQALPETFFLRGADCWGWATWRRAWGSYRSDGAALLAELRERDLTRAFDLDGAARNVDMLATQIAGGNDSWAIRWHASTFLAGMFSLHPGRSLVRNCGHDGSGTHPVRGDAFATRLATAPITVQRIAVAEDDDARVALSRFHRGLHAPWSRLLRRLRRIV